MKLRDTVILVVLAHVGLVFIWVCMGGCAKDKETEAPEKVAMVGPGAGEAEMPPVDTDVLSQEPATPISVQEAPRPSEFILPRPSEAIAPPTVERTEVEPAAEEIRITVKKGDTLWALSRKYHVPISAIVDRNDIQNPALIREGRELIIPAGGTTLERPAPEAGLPATPAGEAPTALPGGSEAVPVAEDSQNILHKVEAGDTIWNLARKYHTESAKILEANNITDPTRLQVGQEIRIPKGE